MLSLPQILEWLLTYRYIILFPVASIEGPIVTIIAGFLASLGFLNMYISYFVIVVADVCSDLGYYFFGRWGRKKYSDKWGRFIGLSTERIKKIDSYFIKHRKKTLFFGKITHAVGAPILFTAGAARVPLWEFFWVNLLGTLPKSLFFLFVGYHFGQAYVSIDKYLDYFMITIISIVLISLLIYYLYNRYKCNYSTFIKKIKKKNILDV